MGDVEPSPWLRVVAGLRGERLDVNVADRLDDTSTLGTKASGVDGAAQVLPKLSAIVSPIPEVSLFANYGRGFHSNDARGVVKAVNAATLITPATGYEGGLRVKPLRGLEVEGAAFVLDLDSELVWNGDDGTTSPSGRTRRQGVEIIGRYRIGNWLFADAEATFTRARYRENAGNGQAVALAPTRTFSAGIGLRPRVGDITPFAAVRVKAIADRAANEDSSLVAQGFTVADANAGVRWRNIEAALDVQNVFNARWREVQFANESRLPFEAAPVSGIHYTPGWPRTVMARATLYWQ
jgi:outer membrane receptor protein involved in Fe transport